MRFYGCQQPWNPLQILAWLLVPTFITQYYFWYIMALQLALQVVLGVVFGLIFAVSGATGWYIMLTDPADPNVIQKRLNSAGIDMRKSVELPKGQKVIENNYCRLCEVHIAPKSKHCRVCDKCVDVFDHHCKWLNTCIGRRNYKVFIAYVSSTFAGAIMHCVTGVGILIACSHQYAADNNNVPIVDTFRSNVPSVPIDFQVYIAITAVFIVLSVVAIGLLGQLFFFHVNLIMKKMTTYEMILLERAKQEAAAKRKAGEGDDIQMRFVPSKATTPGSTLSDASDLSNAQSTPHGWATDTATPSISVQSGQLQGSAGGGMLEQSTGADAKFEMHESLSEFKSEPPSMPETPHIENELEPSSSAELHSSGEAVATEAKLMSVESSGTQEGPGSTTYVEPLVLHKTPRDSDAVSAVSDADMMSPHILLSPPSVISSSQPSIAPQHLDDIVRSEPSLPSGDLSLQTLPHAPPSPLLPNAVPVLKRAQIR